MFIRLPCVRTSHHRSASPPAVYSSLADTPRRPTVAQPMRIRIRAHDAIGSRLSDAVRARSFPALPCNARWDDGGRAVLRSGCPLAHGSSRRSRLLCVGFSCCCWSRYVLLFARFCLSWVVADEKSLLTHPSIHLLEQSDPD
ncbi:hypothetical protein C8Q76DRAFT_753116 [Earliella scabrosa]|nr:hypothetical protein C8Q76DRAFT_753116 [Earliella scabrosa]